MKLISKPTHKNGKFGRIWYICCFIAGPREKLDILSAILEICFATIWLCLVSVWSCCMFPTSTWVFHRYSGFPQQSTEMQIGDSKIDNRCKGECAWLFVSICWPCDGLMTSLGCTGRGHPREAPCQRAWFHLLSWPFFCNSELAAWWGSG